MSSSSAAARRPGPRVRLVAQTQFLPLSDDDWEDVTWATDAGGGEALVEFAGRACYQSWDKPRPSTATNAGFLRHVIDVGHTSVLEHGVVTMYLTGLSQAVAHELVRHRHFSFSQLSPRFVPDDSTAYVEPAAIADDPELHALFTAATDRARAAYDEVREALARRYADLDNSSVRAKQARQAARALLPAALETRIVVTGNYRAWRHFVAMRATDQADLEMRELAVRCLELLQSSAPGVFADFVVSVLADGSRVATSPLVVE